MLACYYFGPILVIIIIYNKHKILTAIVEDSAAVDAADEERTFDELAESIMPY